MEQYKRNNFFNTKKYVSNKETYQSGILMKFIVKKEYLTRIFFFLPADIHFEISSQNWQHIFPNILENC